MPSRFLEDNPGRRYQQLMADRHVGREGGGPDLAQLRHAALAHTSAMAFAREMPTTPAVPGQSNWTQLGPLGIADGQSVGGVARLIVTGRVTEVVPHPTNADIIYVASARGGIWKTTDGGDTWTAKSDNADSLAIGALAISRSSPDTLYAGTGEGNIYYYVTTFPLASLNESYNGSGALKTTNGGSTWTTQGGGSGGVFTGACFYRLKVHPSDPNTVLAATSRGVYRTTDGTNWVHLSNGLPSISTSIIAATDVAFDPVTPSTAYVAFWGNGIYKSTNVTAATPTWTKLAGGLSATGLRRISLAIAPSAPANLYALIGDDADTEAFKGLYVSSNGGAAWTAVSLAGVEAAEAYTNNVAVDAGNPGTVYVSGTRLYKAVRSGATWSVSDIGASIHADHHALASHPTNHQTIYAGCDGGIYKSTDGGATWDDSINEGMCITQLEFMDQHPMLDAVVMAGTQDNGTLQFRNSPAFYHSADGDGGFCAIDQTDARNVIHTYYQNSPERSTEGGNFGTYAGIDTGIQGDGLFYPPLAFDRTTPANVAFGTDRINLDPAQGTTGWPTQVALPGITGRVSAIAYMSRDLIYAGTSAGEVYRLARSGSTWAATAIHGGALPARWIWGLATPLSDLNTLIVAMAGFGTPTAPLAHVWRGAVAGGGASATWTDISGTSPNRVPDIPVNALCDDTTPNTYYVGTDIGVYRTTDGGSNWQPFSTGLPNVAVYDLQLHSPTGRLLRAATHGRGLWQRNLDQASTPNVDIYVRDHLMDGARFLPTITGAIATYDAPLQAVRIGDPLWWWMCADVKVDAPAAGTHAYQMDVADVDYFAFETKLAHRDAQRSTAQRAVTNRVYVQIHNRGLQPATSVTVKLLYANGQTFDLPPDFWTAFPGNGATNIWKPIGAAKTIASISPTRPEMLEWDWALPADTLQRVSLLIVADCPGDPIPSANKVFAINTLVPAEKRVGMRSLSVVNPAP